MFVDGLIQEKIMIFLNLILVLQIFKIGRGINGLLSLPFLKNLSWSVQRMIKTLLIALSIIHISSCFFFLIARLKNYTYDTWVYHMNIVSEEPYNQYLLSLNWSLQTITTIGFGNLTPQNNHELIFAIFWIALGGSYYSFTISNLQALAASIDHFYSTKVFIINSEKS